MIETMQQPRSLRERQDAATEMLRTHHQLWLVTSGTKAHMIPVSYVWDGEVITMATMVRSRTTANLRAHPEVRVAIGTTGDVVMIDGTVTVHPVAGFDEVMADRLALVAHDPRVLPGFHYLRLTPQRVLVWNSFQEFGGRTVMRDGHWLDTPVD